MLLLLLAACPPKTDTDADTDTGTPVMDETAVTSVTPDLDHPWDVYGCQWAYVAGTAADAAFSLQVVLPDADLAAEADVSYSRPLDPATESFDLWDGGSGTGTIYVFDCSDVMEGYSDTHVWTATSATLDVDAVWDHEEPGNECTGAAPNYFYVATFSLLDATLVDDAGNAATVDVGPFTATVGWNGCGG